MTFQEYINNPTGAKTAVMSYRQMYSNLYNEKWNNIMVRENGKINYSLYMDGETYYCHVKVPSETVPDFYYDVIIKMESSAKEQSLLTAKSQFFSNDPNFNYVFAYAFIKHKLHIPELESKMSKTAITKKAVEKNPDCTIGYIKTLYFAYIAMSSKGLFTKIRFKAEAKKFDKKILLSNIKDTETCIEERKNKGEELAKKKEKKTTAPRTQYNNNLINPEVKRIGTIGSNSKIGTIGSNSKNISTVSYSNTGKIKRIGGKR